MKQWIKQFTTEDWIIVFVGAVVLALACIFPQAMPTMPKSLTTSTDWVNAVYMFGFVLLMTYVTLAALRKPLKGTFASLLFIFSSSFKLSTYLSNALMHLSAKCFACSFVIIIYLK